MSQNQAPDTRGREVTPANGQQAVVSVQDAPIIDFSQVPAHIMARAAAIAADAINNKAQITPYQALTAAYHFEQTGEVMGRHAYVGTKGTVAGRVLEGYRGVARKLDMSKYQWRFRPLTPDEEKAHRIQQGDRAIICELDVLAARAQCIRMGVPYDPIIGYSVCRKDNQLNQPAFRDSEWTLRKQARVDALRQVGENTSAEDELLEAEARGVDMGNVRAAQADGGYLNQEQAGRAVDEALREKAIAELSAEERAVVDEVAHNESAQRKLKDAWAQWSYDCSVGGERLPCPGCGSDYSEKQMHTADCAFRLVFPNLPTIEAEPPTPPEPLPAHLAAIEPLRQRILNDAPTKDGPATDRQKEWMVNALKTIAQNTQETDAVLDWLWGFDRPDAANLTSRHVFQLYNWTRVTKMPNGEYRISEDAHKEWVTIVAALNTKLAAPESEEPAQPALS